MCELFGISAKEEYAINEELKKFFTHSKEHPHGWGIACMDPKGVSIEKEPVQAEKSLYLKERLSVPIKVQTAFAHIRYATIGNIAYKNCHPYTQKDKMGRRWTMAHNGTIFEYDPLNPYSKIQQGDTDSERILLYFVDQINQKEAELNRKMEAQERFQLIEELVANMAKGNKLNILLYDGELCYVHTNCANSLYRRQTKNQVLISTSPLEKEGWKNVEFMTLLAYRNGEQIFQGKNHGNEYVEQEEHVKFLYSIFSNL